ncbi:hypothetical protein ACI8AF_00740 [Blastococcus sp. SYSU D00669]
MPCPTCGTTSPRTQLLPGYWRCDALVGADQLVGAGSSSTPGAEPRTCGAIYLQTRTDDSGPQNCRCGERAVGECAECTRLVCADHSDLWQGWRVCDRDLATARMKARAAALAEERRLQEAAAAAEAERRRLRSTFLDLSPAQALKLLYVAQPRTEQEIRSADNVLRRLSASAFTRLCLDVLPTLSATEKTRRSGLRRLSGWAFAGPDYHDRSWFLTAKGDWYRSGSYGVAGAEQGHRGEKVSFDDTEKRAVIYELGWQQSVDSGVA